MGFPLWKIVMLRSWIGVDMEKFVVSEDGII